ncbi:unnamed protein product [Cylindrotheca closterium]|uniref:CRAL-TRIO domain-containing protein n=1 Tax=Cylindrotheca closterium TaxID=2856 RepID=A0AAD2CUC8_9STRA|nr:unnamed protein product [Cylindrotheca closterium]
MGTVKETLQESFPDATEAEVTRFINAYGKDKPEDEKNKTAIEARLKEHLEWRKEHGLLGERDGNRDTDASLWEASVKQAREFDEANGEDESGGSEANSQASRVPVDQILFFHKSEADGKQITDKDGKRIIHLLPGLINTAAGSATFYANCIAYYLDRNLDRNNIEKLTIMIDVRAGTGWPNEPAYKMVSFVKTIVRVFEFNFPERVNKFVVFPIPMLLKGIFNTIKMLFDPTTANKIALATGSALADSPLPKQDVVAHIDEEVLDQTEKIRLGLFREKKKSSGWFS